MVAKRKMMGKEEKVAITDLAGNSVSAPVKTKKPKEVKEPKIVTIEIKREDYSKIKGKWKYATNSVDEVGIIGTLEYLTPSERINFVNELFRVLKSGAKATIITPHWASNRSMGDLAMVWPPVCESWYYHLNKGWRDVNNSTEKRYTCDFEQPTWGYSMHQLIQTRNQEYQHHAMTFWKEAAQDMIATLVKK